MRSLRWGLLFSCYSPGNSCNNLLGKKSVTSDLYFTSANSVTMLENVCSFWSQDREKYRSLLPGTVNNKKWKISRTYNCQNTVLNFLPSDYILQLLSEMLWVTVYWFSYCKMYCVLKKKRFILNNAAMAESCSWVLVIKDKSCKQKCWLNYIWRIYGRCLYSPSQQQWL